MRLLLLISLLLLPAKNLLGQTETAYPLTASETSAPAPLALSFTPLASDSSASLASAPSALTQRAEKIAQETLWRPNSTKALLWGLLPGGGQIYNRKYWKLPLVWGAFTACYYAISWNNRQYQDYHAAYRDISSEDPATNTAWLSFAPLGAQAADYQQYSSLRSTLKRGNDYYRRYRDLSILATVLVYGLSLLDAYVDAELYSFDITPDLALRVLPEVGVSRIGIPAYQIGMNCSLTF